MPHKRKKAKKIGKALFKGAKKTGRFLEERTRGVENVVGMIDTPKSSRAKKDFDDFDKFV